MQISILVFLLLYSFKSLIFKFVMLIIPIHHFFRLEEL